MRTNSQKRPRRRIPKNCTDQREDVHLLTLLPRFVHLLLNILPIPQLAIKQLPRPFPQTLPPDDLERTNEVRVPEARSAEDVEHTRPELRAGLHLHEALSEFEIWR